MVKRTCIALVAAAICIWQPAKAEMGGIGKGDAGGCHVIAHRGGKWAPENTMAAFKKCLDNYVYGLELDIQRCKSGELVVIHDVDLARTAGGSGLVKDKTYDELKKLSAGAWYSPEFKNEKIPLLSEVLQLIDGKLVINIEIKNTPVAYPGIEDDLIAVLKDYKYKDKIIVSSFDHGVLKSLHEKAPDLAIGFLMCGLPPQLDTYGKQVGANHWNPDFGTLRPDAMKKAKEAGYQVNVWTLNTESEWKDAADMHVDSIITDLPVELAKYLARR